ncbi:hypothetical protein [Suipraeoptans intestinalis]|uniref:hypothetical protein n=1 Tax=Suipraeoptans intestinalis TaxID=2606628 RepID=UPI002A7487E1|nr:hypothetical protein [Suipraeoptans intestinalis]MDY3122722.1 hypothetical protein [Suipraeoptans intestinalis]
MLDERKVKIMTYLSHYEETKGKEDFKVSGFYRKDYVGLHNICAFLWVTAGYGILMGLLGIVFLDVLLKHLSVSLAAVLGLAAIAGYVAVLTVYLLLSAGIYNRRHRDARKRVKRYHYHLTRLIKLYEREKE